MEDFKENVIEFLYNAKQATVTFTQGRYISRIKELAEKRPEECKIVHTNEDGSIVAHIPVSWIRVSPPRELSDEVKEKAAERGRKALAEYRAEQLSALEE